MKIEQPGLLLWFGGGEADRLRPSHKRLALPWLQRSTRRVLALDSPPVNAVVGQSHADAHPAAPQHCGPPAGSVVVATEIEHPVQAEPVLNHAGRHDVHVADAHVRRVEPPPLFGVGRETGAARLIPRQPLPVHAVGGLGQPHSARRERHDSRVKPGRARRVPEHPAVSLHLVGEPANHAAAQRHTVPPASLRCLARARRHRRTSAGQRAPDAVGVRPEHQSRPLLRGERLCGGRHARTTTHRQRAGRRRGRQDTQQRNARG
mmetsp:Transcript_14546/g.47493  ORF Transcript_14546/g.47493 Transcript_14546/m.47493 type:complete len:262 (-) Transcript_14546:22-807(-)